ncbi:MAG: hypothetical protein ACUVX8_04345, partial [Candidatus Zipacnadales bacterium]
LGSALSQRWPSGGLAGGAAIAATLTTLWVVGLGPGRGLDQLFKATLSWPLLARTGTTAGLLVPLGLTMGTLFPSGIRQLRGPYATLVPWAWATNGMASVLGSVGAMCGAKLWGFHTVLALGGVCYGVVAALSCFEHLLIGKLKGICR